MSLDCGINKKVSIKNCISIIQKQGVLRTYHFLFISEKEIKIGFKKEIDIGSIILKNVYIEKTNQKNCYLAKSDIPFFEEHY